MLFRDMIREMMILWSRAMLNSRFIILCCLCLVVALPAARAEDSKDTIVSSMGNAPLLPAERPDHVKMFDPYDLPAYNENDILIMGDMQKHVTSEQDTLHDIARHYDLGFVELRAANTGVDSWAPKPGIEIMLPTAHILPRARQKGIVINLAEMRMYYFKGGSEQLITYPIGIGREGLETPLGQTSVVRKLAGPSWYPTERMKTENPNLPNVVGPGAANPLGTHALYLGWPTFLIHGTAKPWGIGRRVSSGCMRMYPEDIKKAFSSVPVGTRVTVVDQPVKLAVIDGHMYIEVNPSKDDTARVELEGKKEAFEGDLPEKLKALIKGEAKAYNVDVDWKLAKVAFIDKLGYPTSIGIVRDVPQRDLMADANDFSEKDEENDADRGFIRPNRQSRYESN